MGRMYTKCQVLSAGSLTPVPTSLPEKMILALWACVESRSRAPAKAHVQLGSWRNMQKDQMKEFLIWEFAHREQKIWDPTWSSKPWRKGGEGFFCHVKWLLCFFSFHCLLGCFTKLVSGLSCVSFLIQAPCPMLCWLSRILFCEPSNYPVPIHFCRGLIHLPFIHVLAHQQRILQ